MSARAAEEWLGITVTHEGNGLLEEAKLREKELGREFIVRRKGPRGGLRYRFTPDMIRRYLPHLWRSKFERVAATASRTVEDIKMHIDRNIDERIANHPQVRELERRSEQTIVLVERLASQVKRLSRNPVTSRRIQAG